MQRVDDATALARAWLENKGAREIPHPGGTLDAHLIRVADLLRSWGASSELVLAGLCHAAYGTDGFARSLLSIEQRDELIAIIGERAEGTVLTYCACDRTFTYKQLATGSSRFKDRFSGLERDLGHEELHNFVELTFANELDLANQNASLGNKVMNALAPVFDRCEALVSPKASRSYQHTRRQFVSLPIAHS